MKFCETRRSQEEEGAAAGIGHIGSDVDLVKGVQLGFDIDAGDALAGLFGLAPVPCLLDPAALL